MEKSDGSIFNVKPITHTVTMKFVHHSANIKLTGIKLKQLNVISNIGTTGHKLQGSSKENLIVFKFDYRTKNWIYIVLSRVKTFQGLFLLEKLEFAKLKPVDNDLLKDDQRLRKIEKQTIKDVNKNFDEDYSTFMRENGFDDYNDKK